MERHTTRLSDAVIKVSEEWSSLDCMRYTVRGKRQKHWQSEGEEGGL